ncbi:MAG TPA: trypsin-like peptidase domain-containing protein [Candidatus Polarisedimenticolia bacterium]|nr:trypsin-like peptidase domain-containing protein [Candidatus Polarisedimenticolia bacterium]
MRTSRRDLLRLAVTAAALVPFSGLPVRGENPPETCPKCGAPRRPGAAFCVQCGAKFAVAAPAAAPAGPSVVQVVAAHDNELTSTFASIVWGSNLRVDSMLGSAFAIAPGEFITDCGLLAGAREINLRTPSGRTVAAQVVGTDPMIGIGLLKADVEGIVPLSLRRDEPARLGEGMNALGYPSGSQARGEPVTSQGVVSGMHRGGTRIHPVEDYLQSDASLPRGLAGGPMLDGRGRVIGMSTAFVMGGRVFLGPQSGIGFGIPADWIDRGLTWIRAGSPPRGWIGALAVTADSENRERYHLPAEARLVVEQVFPESAAAASGLKRGDGLVAIAGEPITTLVQAQQRLLAAAPGQSLPLGIVRATGPASLEVTLRARPDRPRLAALDALRFFGDLEIEARGEDLVVGTVRSGSTPSYYRIAAGDTLKSVLSKKDWEHGATDNSRWRSVRDVAELEERLATAYSDLDFAVGLRFRGKDGGKREMYVWEILTPTPAL